MINYLFTKTPLVFFVQSFWRDEAFSYLLAKQGFLSIIVNSARDFSPPFYYFVLHFWMMLFGKSEIALRSLSLIFYMGTIYVAFMILNEVMKFSVKKSLVYLLLFVINPLLLYYAFEARMYTMLAFFSTLSYYALYKKKSKLYILAAVLGLYTHYFMVLVVAAQFFFSKFKKSLVLFAFAPWVLYILLSKNFINQSFWITGQGLPSLFTFVVNIFTGYESDFKFFDKSLMLVAVPIWGLMIFLFFKTRKDKPHEKELVKSFFIWGLVIPFFVAVISLFKPVFLSRYLIFSSIGLTFLMIAAFEKMPMVARTMVIAFFVAIVFSYQSFQIKDRQKTDMRTPVAEIKRLMKPGDALYVTSELDFFTAKYYLGSDNVFIYGKEYAEIPDYVGKVLIYKTDIKTELPMYPKKAYILDDWGSYKIQALF